MSDKPSKTFDSRLRDAAVSLVVVAIGLYVAISILSSIVVPLVILSTVVTVLWVAWRARRPPSSGW